MTSKSWNNIKIFTAEESRTTTWLYQCVAVAKHALMISLMQMVDTHATDFVNV
jgi:hypothetical protein